MKVPRAIPARVAGLLMLAAGLAGLLLPRPGRPGPAIEPVAHAAGAMRTLNSQAGEAILSASNMAPGSTVTGEVTIRNDGDGSGRLALRQARRSQEPGAGGGWLFRGLRLDVSEVGSGRLLFSGDIGAMGPSDAGAFRPGRSRTYGFTATLPEEGSSGNSLGGDNRFQGASLSVDYRWGTDGRGVVRGISCPFGQIATDGADDVQGTTRADRLVTKDGDDALAGGSGTDCLFGGEDDDMLDGGPAKDELRGGFGDDVLDGGPGADRLRGRQGDDVLSGGPGRDSLRGTGGDDVIRADDGALDFIRCGSGDDVAVVDAADKVQGCETTEVG